MEFKLQWSLRAIMRTPHTHKDQRIFYGKPYSIDKEKWIKWLQKDKYELIVINSTNTSVFLNEDVVSGVSQCCRHWKEDLVKLDL